MNRGSGCGLNYRFDIVSTAPGMIAEGVCPALCKETKAVTACEREGLRISFHRQPTIAANHHPETCLCAALDAKPPGSGQFQTPVNHAFNAHGGKDIGDRVHVGSLNWTNRQQFWTIDGRASRLLDIDTSMGTSIHKLLGVAAVSILCFSLDSSAAELAPDTLQAWNEYIRTENSKIAGRSPASAFLWIDESPDRQRRVRDGEILISPAGKDVPKSIPHGLIHHWIGAAFLPDTRLEDVFNVVRDYGHYKNYYAPNVLDSRPLHQADCGKRFSLVILNKALLAKTALDAEFEESYKQLDEKKWYSVTSSTRVQQVDNYAEPEAHRWAADTGSGYVWRLYSLSRFEQRDGGVYIELEAIALSRNVPVSLHWLVNPIVRRVSRNSLEVSLQKTEEAIHSAQSTRSPVITSNDAALRAAK